MHARRPRSPAPPRPPALAWALVAALVGCGSPALIPNEPPPFGAGDTGGRADTAALDAWPCSAATPGNTHTLRMRNDRASTVALLWVDPSCAEIPYAVLQPGVPYEQLTGDGHVWLFRDSVSDEVLRWIRMNDPVEEVTLQ